MAKLTFLNKALARRWRRPMPRESVLPQFEYRDTPYRGGWTMPNALDQFVPLNAAACAMRDAMYELRDNYHPRLRALTEEIVREKTKAGRDNTPVIIELKRQRDALEEQLLAVETAYITAAKGGTSS